MSYMSNKAIELDEARDLCDYDLVACELSFHKDAVEALAKSLSRMAPVYHAYGHGLLYDGPLKFEDCAIRGCVEAREALAKAKELKDK